MAGLLLLVALLLALAAGVSRALEAVGRQRAWPAVLLIVSAPLEVYRTSVGPFNLSLFRMALVVAVIALLVDMLRRPPRELVVRAPIALYVVLIAVQLLSLAFVTSDPGLGTKFALQYVAGLAAVFVVLRFLTRDDLMLGAAAYVAAAAIPAIASAWRVLVPGGDAPLRSLPGLGLLPIDPNIQAAREKGSYLLEGVLRMHGTFGDPNHFGFFAAVALLVAVGLLIAVLNWMPSVFRATGSPRTLRWSLTLAVAILTVLVVGSYSRSSWLLAVGGLALLGLLAGRSALRPLLRRRTLLWAVPVLAAGVAMALPAVYERLDPDTRGTAISTDEHLRTMDIALALFTSRPITGTGIGGYGEHAGQPELVSSSHSTLLTVAAELGAPGLALLLTIIGLTSFYGVRSVRRIEDHGRRVVAAALVAAWIAMAAANLVYEVWADDFQWMLFALVLTATRQPVLRVRVAWPLRSRLVRLGT